MKIEPNTIRRYIYPLVYAFVLWYLFVHLGIDEIRTIMANGYLR